MAGHKLGKYTNKSDKAPPTNVKTNGGNGGYERRQEVADAVGSQFKMSKSGEFAASGKWDHSKD